MATQPKEQVKRVQEYKDLASGLEDLRKPWELQWKEISKYVAPMRQYWSNEDPKSEVPKAPDGSVFDTKPANDADTLKRGLIGYNVGPRIRWAKITLSDKTLAELPFVKDWLEAGENIVYKIFNNSKFYTAIAQYLDDLIKPGTATMLVEDPVEYMKLTYSCRHPKETFITTGEDGMPDLKLRRIWLKGRTMLQRYTPEELGKELYKVCEEGPLDYHLIYNFVHKNTEHFVEGYENLRRPWMSVEIYEAEDRILRETGYYEDPLIVGRWMTNSDEDYGRSPCFNALPEIRRINGVGETLMESADLSVRPPLNIPDSMKGQERIIPWGYNYYKRDNRKIETVDIKSNYPIGLDLLQRMYDNLEDQFHTKLFSMLTQATRQMTAREINERMGERVALLSAPLTNINTEVLAPLVKTTFFKALRNGWMPQPPMALLQSGAQIEVDFVGPLAQAQLRYHQAHAVNGGLAVLGAISQAKQSMEVWDNCDTDDLSRHVMESEGFPETSIREIPMRDKMRAARAEAERKQRELEQQAEAAKSLPALGKRPQAGSPAEKMMDQALS